MSPNAPLNTVCVVGLGYIGLPTAAVLAQAGKRVIGVDVKQSNVDAINAGTVPFVEEGLETVVAGAVAQGRLSAQTDTPEADAYIVSVPTPFKGDHDADLSYIEAAARGIAPQLHGGELVVLESTSPPGATEFMADVILGIRPEFTKEPNLPNSLYFTHAPERVLPGRIMIEMVENDRIIGGLTVEASEMNRDLYASFCSGELLLTDARTAEMAKLTENAFRDVNIAFANELSMIADRQGIDVWELIELANHHPRVNILQPGPGVGGHCIAVDPWFIVSAERETAKLIATARNVNDSKPELVISKVLERANRLKDPVVAALGIAFKANIDDLRESPSKDITIQLADRLDHGTVLVVEPNIDELPKELSGRDNVELSNLDDAVSRADIVLLMVDHDPFKQLDRETLQEKVVVDTKGLWR
ncbi:UDP-N-acetyl-D-mannosamine dehydrogenase [Brachybacterium sp. MASK1Z-5]|uniref:UDP-N-acetyl-D-mannosamine dehydrogenase n=1 Tax=Brachybacterium halotolerans TaxID=2795215 RepID=A0ABS1B7V3_9MICO|nr:UDP-N-acetyl-D-mannosamine dehydrogenase [Brachybacterium halotolerans]MBK0330725.1 UDP-N-acetyl-D-mannosamine dehydrogenase [Brachybacterium halotolerans]